MGSEMTTATSLGATRATVAKNLALARMAREMTQEQLAEAAKLSRATIAQIEGGDGDPRLSTLIDIATALDISPILLLVDEPDLRILVRIAEEGPDSFHKSRPSATDVEEMRRLLETGLTKNRIRAAKIGVAAAQATWSAEVGAAIGSALFPGVGTILGAIWAASLGASIGAITAHCREKRMSSEPSTLLGRLEKARGKCIRLAKEINRFLADNDRPTVEVIQADKLRFALMGQYNAGKSTLVNALLGEAVAPTGDIPTTRQVHTYDFRDFQILDLPGSDARATEQQEAERALREVHLVLYVASSQTGLDYESFWNDLRNLTDSGQHWLLAVNDKQPHSDEASERSFREVVLTRFRTQAREMVRLTDWDGRVFWINADNALRARLAEPPKRRLEAVSGIVPLENQLVELLSQNDDFLRNVPRLTDLRNALADAEKEWGDRLESDESRRLNAALQRCDSVQEKLVAAVNEIAQEHFSHLRDALAGLLSRRLSAGDSRALDAEATDLIQGTFQSSVEAFEPRCQAELQTLVARLGGPTVPGKVVVEKELNLNLGSLPQLSQSGGFDWGSLLKRLATSAPVVTQLIQGLAVEAAPTLVQEGAKVLANEGSKQGAKALAGEGGMQVAKITAKQGAGQILRRIVGPAVMILAAGWEIYTGWRKAKEEERQKQAAMREVEYIAVRAAAVARAQFLGRASRSVSDALAPLIHQLSEELRARGQQGRALEARLAQAGELRSQLQQVVAELNARSQE